MSVDTIVLDACIVITFGNVHQIDLIGEVQTYRVVVSAMARAEVTRDPARSQLDAAIAAGSIGVAAIDPDVPCEQEAFRRHDASVRFRGRADAEVLALAETRGWIVGSDEIPLQRQAAAMRTPGFAGTLDFLKLAVTERRLTIEKAMQLLHRLDVGPTLTRRVEAKGSTVEILLLS